MPDRNTKYIDEIIDSIARYQDHCFSCPNYRHRECGFAFPEARFPEDKRIFAEVYQEMDYEERRLCDTKMSGEPCEEQPNSVAFLDSIEEDLENVAPGIDEDSVNTYLRRMYRIMVKHKDSDPLMQNTSIRSDVKKAIQLILAKLDLDALEEGVSILRLINASKLGYTRKDGLFQIFPPEMAIPLIRKAIVQNPEGYYKGNGEYDPDIEDTVIQLDFFLGKDWREAQSSLCTLDTIALREIKPIEEKKVKKYGLNEFISQFSHTDIWWFVSHLNSSLRNTEGFQFDIKMGFDEYIKKCLTLSVGANCGWMNKVAAELRKEIEIRAHDENKLTVYISELLSRFDTASRFLYREPLDEFSGDLFCAYVVAEQYRYYPYQKFWELFQKAKDEAAQGHAPGTEEYMGKLIKLLQEDYFDSEVHDGDDDVLVNLYLLRSTFNSFEAALEGALLLSGVKYDFKYYEELTKVTFREEVTDISVAGVMDVTAPTIVSLSKKLNHRVKCLLKPGESKDEYYDRIFHEREHPEEKADDDDYDDLIDDIDGTPINPGVRPPLTAGPRLADIPWCGVEEVDALGTYLTDAETFATYYAQEYVDRFRKVCYSKIDEKGLTTEDKKIWVLRVLQALDSVFAIASGNEAPMQGVARDMYIILECTFMQMAEPICVKRIGLENDLNCIVSDLLDDSIGDNKPCTEPYRFYTVQSEIGGNALYFERKMCDSCELAKCPYRRAITKGMDIYIPDRYPQDILSAKVGQHASGNGGIPAEIDFEQIYAVVSRILGAIGEEYAKVYEEDGYSWDFISNGTLFAYIGLKTKEYLGIDEFPWTRICERVKTRPGAGPRYLDEKACKFKNPDNRPRNAKVVDDAFAELNKQ